MRLGTHWLWFLVAALEVLLLARIVTMLIFGVTGTMGGTSAPVSVLFVISGVFTNPFDLGVGFLVPLSGLSHAFDVAALLVMDVLFFTTLLITKLALWYARELDTSGEPVSSAAKRLAARAAKMRFRSGHQTSDVGEAQAIPDAATNGATTSEQLPT